MIAIGNGEKCPYCIKDTERKKEDIFINEADNDFFKHCTENHEELLIDDLFGEDKDEILLGGTLSDWSFGTELIKDNK